MEGTDGSEGKLITGERKSRKVGRNRECYPNECIHSSNSTEVSSSWSSER